MRRTRGRIVHVASLDDLDRRIAAGASSFRGWRLQGLDLGQRGEVLRRVELAGATFVGCRFADGDDELARRSGALVLPGVDAVPVDTAREELYTADELYDAARYADSLDARAYAWAQRAAGTGSGGADRDAALARALHDHAVDQALSAWVAGRRLVGVMGGHAVERGDAAYADAARLGRALGTGLTVATGGGPGAMEAANLGARLAGRPDHELDAALEELAAVPSYRPSVDAWARAALTVRDRLPRGSETLGIPTWHYGHEPPNVFASAIAKYFRNSTREAILLEMCDAGIVFLPGYAGTVQEVFQDACENYYADESSVAAMVLVGRTYWTETLPAWPLLHSLARGRTMEDRVHLVDSLDEAAAVLGAAGAGGVT